MRIPYAPKEPVDPSPEVEAIYERIKERRNPRPLIPLDLALLHNPNIADGFNTLLGAIRSKSSLSLAAMEIAVCYVAVLNKATYEWTAHAPLALKAGVTRDALEAVLRGDVKNAEALSDEEVDVLEFTYQSTKNVDIEERLMEKLKARYTEQQVMELTITVAAYNVRLKRSAFFPSKLLHNDRLRHTLTPSPISPSRW